MAEKEIKIGRRKIGSGHPVFIVAELSCNHLQKYDIAIKTIRSMKESGADAVKLQTYTPDTITIDCGNKYFKIRQGTLWDGRTLYKLYQQAYTPWEWQPKLKKIAEDIGLIFFSSPFDCTAVDYLEEMNVPAYKVPSFEITDTPLIEYIASKGKPVLISTGIADLDDIKEAIAACKRAGNDRIALLKCTSAYPAPFEEMNLRAIPMLQRKFKTVLGISDHTLGTSVSVASVVLGASIIERHFILDRKLGGPDSPFSLEPGEFKAMVKAVRQVEKAMGTGAFGITKSVKKTKEFARSLFAVRDIVTGEPFTNENVRSIRPGYGLHPKNLKAILGKTAKRPIKRGMPLKWDLIA